MGQVEPGGQVEPLDQVEPGDQIEHLGQVEPGVQIEPVATMCLAFAVGRLARSLNSQKHHSSGEHTMSMCSIAMHQLEGLWRCEGLLQIAIARRNGQ